MKNSAPSQSHDEVFLLQPWYVNGTLGEAEHALVTRHLEECDVCRAEVSFLSQVEAAANVQDGIYIIPQNGFAHMLRKLDQDDAGETVRSSAPAVSRLSRWLQSDWFDLKGLAVATPVIVALAVVGVTFWPAHDPVYETLTSSGYLDKDRVKFKLTLSKDAEKKFLQDYFRLVLNMPATITDTEDGSYTVQLSAGMEPETMAKLFKQLKRNERIESVELVVE